MNDFSARKIGEVLGIVDTLLGTCDTNKDELIQTLGEERISEIISISKSHKDNIRTIADRAQILTTVMSNFESTKETVNKIKDLYLELATNDEAILNWLAMFESILVSNASMLIGIAEEIGHAELTSLANSLYSYHQELHSQIILTSHDIGRDRSRN